MRNKQTRLKTRIHFTNAFNDFMELCAENQYDDRELRGKRRFKDIVQKRIKIAKILHDTGYSLPAIAWAMNKDHTTIMFYVKPEMREAKNKRSRERYEDTVRVEKGLRGDERRLRIRSDEKLATC